MKANAPPKGFRKAIPWRVKLEVVLQQGARCATCGESLGALSDIEFDHVPALGLRPWNEEAQDTEPKANDGNSIHAKHADCHAAKTTGRKGESKLSRNGGDVSEIAKLRRIEAKEAEFRRRLLAKGTDETVKSDSPKRTWPKRRSAKDDGHAKRATMREARSRDVT